MASQAPATDEDLRSFMRSSDYGRPGLAGDRVRAQVRAGYAERYPDPLERDATGRQVDGAIHVRSYERHGDDGRLHTVQVHERGAPPRAAPQQAWIGQPNQSWREQIAHEESRGTTQADFGYGVRGAGAGNPLGRYQITTIGFRGAGWQNDRGAWTQRAAEAGVTSDASFLSNPAAQEAALTDYMRENQRQLRVRGIAARVGQDIQSFDGEPIRLTEAGLAAAAHREGPRAVERYLDHRNRGLPRPPSIPNQRTDRSVFNEVERRLREYAATPFQQVP